MYDGRRVLQLSKHKKLFFLAPVRARTVLNALLECMQLYVYDKGDHQISKIPVYFRQNNPGIITLVSNVENSGIFLSKQVRYTYPGFQCQKYTGIFGIFGIFRSFGKIFGKFRKLFGHSKPR